MNEDVVVSIGGSIKALSDRGEFAGHLVIFNVPDLDHEYFTAKTNYWLSDRKSLPVVFDHGRDSQLGRQPITSAQFEIQNAGIWINGRLPIERDNRVIGIWAAIKSGQLGLSSGSSSHLVERVPRGPLTEIVSWPIVEGSLTRTPAQPLSKAMALKSLAPLTLDELLERQAVATSPALAEWRKFQALRRQHSDEATALYSEFQKFVLLHGRGCAFRNSCCCTAEDARELYRQN